MSLISDWASGYFVHGQATNHLALNAELLMGKGAQALGVFSQNYLSSVRGTDRSYLVKALVPEYFTF